MDFRQQIQQVFEGRAFMRPLFYSYPGGLRIELSEGRTSIDKFLVALDRAQLICRAIFDADQPLLVCLRHGGPALPWRQRSVLRELHDAGIRIPRSRCLWHDPVRADGEAGDDDGEVEWLNVAFEAPASWLPRLLWCAFSVDLGVIRPRPHCGVYLFAPAQGIMVFPYDDRGMDVVGPNHDRLAALYRDFNHHLLDYDRAVMDETFAGRGTL